MLFFCQKCIDGDCRVTRDVVVVQYPSACNALSHTCYPFPESFKDFPIKSLIGLPTRGSSSTCSRPSKKDLCHLNTCAMNRECSHKPFVTFIIHSSRFVKLYTKFDGTT